jgi:hypothetical protein
MYIKMHLDIQKDKPVDSVLRYGSGGGRNGGGEIPATFCGSNYQSLLRPRRLMRPYKPRWQGKKAAYERGKASLTAKRASTSILEHLGSYMP